MLFHSKKLVGTEKEARGTSNIVIKLSHQGDTSREWNMRKEVPIFVNEEDESNGPNNLEIQKEKVAGSKERSVWKHLSREFLSFDVILEALLLI